MSPPTQTVFVRRAHFSCGHRYFNPQFSEQKNQEVFGACYSPYGHGHNYTLEAHFTGSVDTQTGMIIHLVEVDRGLDFITKQLDHKFLNEDVEYFKHHIPTTENLSIYIYEQLQPKLPNGVTLLRVRLYECEDIWAEHGLAKSPL